MKRCVFKFRLAEHSKQNPNNTEIRYLLSLTSKVCNANTYNKISVLIKKELFGEAHNIIHKIIELRENLGIKVSKALLKLENALWETSVNNGENKFSI